MTIRSAPPGSAVPPASLCWKGSRWLPCGARTLERRARTELTAIGIRPRTTQHAGADSLTHSERRVVELAAAGGTTRETAQKLFVTEKTVEIHLGRSFRSSTSHRGQLPDVLARAAG